MMKSRFDGFMRKLPRSARSTRERCILARGILADKLETQSISKTVFGQDEQDKQDENAVKPSCTSCSSCRFFDLGSNWKGRRIRHGQGILDSRLSQDQRSG